MTKATIAGGALAVMLGLTTLAAGCGPTEDDVDPATATPATATPPTEEIHQGLLYGLVTTTDGTIYEGRLRWGEDEEAVWGNHFNGRKDENRWAAYVPDGLLPSERQSIGALGFEVAAWNSPLDLGRPFMVRFGDIARIDARGREIRVTLKSGAMYDLDRYAADDLADGLRIWDVRGDVVDISEWRIQSIELLPAPDLGTGPRPLHGTVHTRQGEFTGLIQWEREQCLGSDELYGRTAEGEIRLRFDTIGSIERRSPDSTVVTLLDGSEVVLSGIREAGQGNRGTYVDDPRYGRVLVSWDAFERVDFSPGGTGPAYDDFPRGLPLTGKVFTRSGRSFSGSLVFDLDESETTETLDAPSSGVDYIVPFGLIASVVLPDPEERGAPRARVILHNGEELELELSGDLGEFNAGMLIFVDDGERPAYVPWSDVEQIELDRPPEM